MKMTCGWFCIRFLNENLCNEYIYGEILLCKTEETK